MKFFLLNLLIVLGLTKAYANTSEIFLKVVPKSEAAESSSGDCSGTNECGGCHACVDHPTKSGK